MHGFELAFDHLGLATRNAKQTLAFLRGLGYRSPEPVYDPLQRVHLVLCEHAAMPAVEVIYAAGDEVGPLDAILAQQPQSIYHLCFRTPDLTQTLAAFKAASHRIMVVSPPQPAVLFGGRRVSFYMVRNFGLIEIIEDLS